MEFYREADFKKTEIGKIPKNWEIKSVSSVCEKPEYGYTQSATHKPVGPKFLRITDIQNGRVFWDAVPFCKCPDSLVSKYLLRAGDILFARSGATTGKSYLIKDCPRAIFASYLIRIQTKEEIISEYLYYIFNSYHYWKQVKQKMGGSAQGGLNASLLSEILVHFPKKREQEKIASILSRIDDTIQQTDSIIQKIQELKKGLMQELLTKGIGHTEFKYSEELECEIPKGWTVKEIRYLCDINKASLSNKVSRDYEFFYIDIGAISYPGAGPNKRKMKYENAPSRAKRIVEKDDILVSTVRPYLRAFTYISENINNLICSTGYAVLSAKNDNDPKYVFQYILTERFLNQLIPMGSSYPAVTAEQIGKVKIPQPPKDEQRQIASILSNVDDQIEKERRTKEQFEKMKKGLMQILLTGKVRVKVN